MTRPNYYQTLSIPRDATADDIQHAYRAALERAYGQQPPDAEYLASIRNAHRILSDAELRGEHDAALPPPRRATPPPPTENTLAEDGPSPSWRTRAIIAIALLVLIAWWLRSRPSSAPAPATAPAIAQPASSAAIAATAAQTTPSSANEERSMTSTEMFSRWGGSVGRIHVYSAGGSPVGTGSAVAIGPATIITNCHVLVGGVRAELQIGGQRMATQLQVADQELDLCRMHVAGSLRPVQLGSVSDVHNNVPVFAIGAPGGGPVIITEGVVTTLHGIRAGNVIQTTAAVSPGSSGGGLFTTNGKLVGIVTFQQRGPEQRNYAIPVDWLNRMETREGSGQADEVIPPVYYN